MYLESIGDLRKFFFCKLKSRTEIGNQQVNKSMKKKRKQVNKSKKNTKKSNQQVNLIFR